MKTIIFIASSQILVACIWYKIGYNKREQEFQKNPTIFVRGVENALYVEQKDGVVNVRVYNPKLVRFLK